MMNQHFDEAYYQSGSERGTQYRDYLEGAKRNRTYFEIAQSIFQIFRPRRTLEIGCATGVIVSHLRTFDVEAHGIDVSDWAVENRLTDTVIHGTAETLPFEDGYFDLVYSVHALEHLPPDAKDRALDEISRVCHGFQLHMMPMLESGPYVGDRFGHLLNLRTDPTHHLLYEREWWIGEFANRGFTDLGVRLAVAHDTEYFELSDCQILMHRGDAGPLIIQRVAELNHGVAGTLSSTLNGRPGPGLDIHLNRLRESVARELQTHSIESRPSADDSLAIGSGRDNQNKTVGEFKCEQQRSLLKQLSEDAAEIHMLRSQLELQEGMVAAREDTLSKTQTELQCRYSELGKLTKALLAEEDRASERQRESDQLRSILRAMISGGRWWWNLLPGPMRRRKQSRRIARLGLFDSEAYSRQFPDVVAAGYDPLQHYIMHGIDEIRSGTR